MSAECGKCGSDIVYPVGTWPIGECPSCSLDEKIVMEVDVMDAASLANALPMVQQHLIEARNRLLIAQRDVLRWVTAEQRVRRLLKIVSPGLVATSTQSEASGVGNESGAGDAS